MVPCFSFQTIHQKLVHRQDLPMRLCWVLQPLLFIHVQWQGKVRTESRELNILTANITCFIIIFQPFNFSFGFLGEFPVRSLYLEDSEHILHLKLTKALQCICSPLALVGTWNSPVIVGRRIEERKRNATGWGFEEVMLLVLSSASDNDPTESGIKKTASVQETVATFEKKQLRKSRLHTPVWIRV